MALPPMWPGLILLIQRHRALITALLIRCRRLLRFRGSAPALTASVQTSPSCQSEQSEDGAPTPNPLTATQPLSSSSSPAAGYPGSFSGVNLSLIWFSRVPLTSSLQEAQNRAPLSDCTPNASESSQAQTDSPASTSTADTDT